MKLNGYIPPSVGKWQAATRKVCGDDVSAQLSERMEGTIDGSIFTMPMPWAQMARVTRALQPGCITVMCGDPGSTKSLLTLQLFWFLHANRHKVALYELEGDKVFHAYRLLAQLSGNSDITDTDWVKAHPDEARYLRDQHEGEMAAFGQRIWASPNDPVSHDELLAWVDEQGAAGVRLFGIDPVTAICPTREPWIADQHFVTAVKKRLEKHGASLWCVTHPRKGVKGSNSWDDLAGGAAWSKFTDTVLWLEGMKEPEQVTVLTSFGRDQYQINRRVRVCKARNGKGYGMKIGMHFEPKSLTFDEVGVIVGYAA